MGQEGAFNKINVVKFGARVDDGDLVSLARLSSLLEMGDVRVWPARLMGSIVSILCLSPSSK